MNRLQEVSEKPQKDEHEIINKKQVSILDCLHSLNVITRTSHQLSNLQSRHLSTSTDLCCCSSCNKEKCHKGAPSNRKIDYEFTVANSYILYL